MPYHPLPIGSLVKGTFLERPHRFCARCQLGSQGTVDAHLANPGRLWELLFPGATVYLAAAEEISKKAAAKRSTRWTVTAVERDGVPIMLHTHWANDVARLLIREKQIAELCDAEIVRPEVRAGKSRFDFLLRQGGHDVYLEVKSCTLFGNGVAMFPDAVTQRGRKHLLELVALRRRGVRCCVLFLAHTPSVRWFMPDYHTDLAFSQTLLDVRRRVQILPVALRWNQDLSLAPETTALEVPWDYLRREARDRGSYLLLLTVTCCQHLSIGRLGEQTFPPGYYLYVGSAMRGLTARLSRHLRLRKRLHWHIDYLRRHADQVTALPIRATERLECALATALAEVCQSGPVGFGCSDCKCPTHLFWLPENPLQQSGFHRLLQSFRMRPPERQ